MSLLTTEKSRVLRTAALGTGGLLLLSLGFAGASAAPSEGTFAVKAVDQENAEVFAQRGDPSLAVAPGGGGTVEPPVEAALYTMKCGPASFPVTTAMRDLSNSNADTFKTSGSLDGTTPHADGWSLLAADGKLGEPIPTAKPSSLTIIGANPTRIMGNVDESAAGCNYNMADKTRSGMNFYSYVASNGDYTEGRTIGSIYTQVMRKSDGSSTVIARATPPAAAQTPYYSAKSTAVPYDVTLTADSTRVAIALPATTDNYNHIESGSRSDGSGWVQFKLATDPTMGNNTYPAAKRQSGPSYVEYNAAGLITKFTYTNGSGAAVSETPASPYTVADYNAHTGQNWDGNLYKPSSFDLTVPFQPTAPTS